MTPTVGPTCREWERGREKGGEYGPAGWIGPNRAAGGK
jgi:hypothetical protein